MEDSISNKKFQEYKLLSATTPKPAPIDKLSNQNDESLDALVDYSEEPETPFMQGIELLK